MTKRQESIIKEVGSELDKALADIFAPLDYKTDKMRAAFQNLEAVNSTLGEEDNG